MLNKYYSGINFKRLASRMNRINVSRSEPYNAVAAFELAEDIILMHRTFLKSDIKAHELEKDLLNYVSNGF